MAVINKSEFSIGFQTGDLMARVLLLFEFTLRNGFNLIKIIYWVLMLNIVLIHLNGNVTKIGNRYFYWDYADRMRAATNSTASDSCNTSMQSLYLYDVNEMRVMKVVKCGPIIKITIYIDGIYEIYQEQTKINSSLSDPKEHKTYKHIMNGSTRIAINKANIVQTKPDNEPLALYYHGDHLRSSQIVTTEDGELYSQEEYYPYGETSFGSYRKKRYRYNGKERDEETGLYYYGARYYAPWLRRWCSVDPAGTMDGYNMYLYAKSAPINFTDEVGLLATGPKLVFDHSPIPLDSAGEDASKQNLKLSLEGDWKAFKYNIIPESAKSSVSVATDIEEASPKPILANTEAGGGFDPYGPSGGEEHRGKTPSKKGKHQKGKSRKSKSRGGEKADKRRPFPRRRPKNWKGTWPPRNKKDQPQKTERGIKKPETQPPPSKKQQQVTPGIPPSKVAEQPQIGDIGLIVAGIVIIIATIVEDVGTLGVGILDDPITIGVGIAMIKLGAR